MEALEPQPRQPLRSSLHWKVVPACSVASVKRNTGRREWVLLAGAKVILVNGTSCLPPTPGPPGPGLG
jgi:hypothetical protein